MAKSRTNKGKSKRTISPIQRDKDTIYFASILKRKGIISKQAKLHGGHYVSRSVAAKVKEFKHAAQPTYRGVKVSPEQARAARSEGYQVSNGRVIVPNEHDFIKRVKKGMLSGMKPVKGGFTSEVYIPFNADNSAQLLDWLANGNLEDLKLPHEFFAFTFFGNTSRRAFPDAATMRQYLEHYRQDEMMKGLKLFRLHPDDQNAIIRAGINGERVGLKGTRVVHRKGGRQDGRGQYTGRRSYAEKMALLKKNAPGQYNRVKREEAAKEAARRARLEANPKLMAEYKERARKRAKESYNRRKGK